MDPLPSSNPYVAPAAASIVADSSRALHARIIGYTFLLSALWSAVIGASLAIRIAPGLLRFGGIEFVPRVVALAATREEAAVIALLVSGLTAVRVVHRASRKDRALTIERSLAHSLGAALLLLYPANVASFLAAAAILMRVAYAMPFAAFAASTRAILTASDLLAGFATTAVYAVFVALIAPRALRLVAQNRRGLFAKLAVTAVVLFAASFILGSALSFAWS